MVIKNLVLSGGAYNGLHILGALRHLDAEGYYQTKNIERIYAASAGALVGALLCMRLSWDDLMNYIINRPWEKLIKIPDDVFFQTLTKKGLFDKSLVAGVIEYLLGMNDLPVDVTLAAFHEFSGIELHISTLRLSDFNLVEMTHISHPEVALVDAVYMSTTIPFVFQPVFMDGSYYVDGGLINNFPIKSCMEQGGNADETLALKIKTNRSAQGLGPDSSIFYYGFFLFDKLIREINAGAEDTPNTVLIPCLPTNMKEGAAVLSSKEKRREYVERGAEYARLFLTYRTEAAV